jgi:hypothetical protein
MTKFLTAAVALAMLAACASAPDPAPEPTPAPEAAPISTPAPAPAAAWSYSFDAGPGLALARLTQAGAPLAEIACKAPKGPVEFRDYRLSASTAATAQLTIGSVSATGPVTIVAGEGGAKALSLAIDPRDAVFKALAPNSPVGLAAGGQTLAWDANAASRLNDVINACVAKGS